MENNNLEKQTNESNPKSTRKIAIWCCVAAAICLVIATALVMHFRNSDGTNVSDTDTSASGRDSDQLQGSETEAETEAPKPEFEISEAGVLTSYNGDDETVVIPDNVISIGADAFGASPRVDAITTVRLGKSVEDIDVQAFVSLTKLENVEVPEENGNFIFTDGVLIKADNSVFFCMPSIVKADYDMFNIFYDVISDNIDVETTASLVSGRMIANIEIKNSDNDGSWDGKHYLICNMFEAYGYSKNFDTPYSDEGFNDVPRHIAYEFEEGVVYSNRDLCGSGDTWIFTKDDIVKTEIITPRLIEDIPEVYNYSVIVFTRGENGALNYIRTPRKYLSIGGELDGLGYMTSPDEFAKEEGYIKVENGNIVYYPEKTFTARDLGYDDYMKNELEAQPSGSQWYGLSIEKFFELNSKMYESAK